MTAQPKKAKPQKVSKEAIAQCLSNALDAEITPITHPQLLDYIERAFDIFWKAGKLKECISPVNKFDDAINALLDISPFYCYPPHHDIWKNLWKVKGFEEVEFSQMKKTQKSKRRREKLLEIIRELIKAREEIRKVFQSVPPGARLEMKEPKKFATYMLWRAIEKECFNRKIKQKQIGFAVYELLRLRGVEEKESKNPGEMIRKRIERYSEKIN